MLGQNAIEPGPTRAGRRIELGRSGAADRRYPRAGCPFDLPGSRLAPDAEGLLLTSIPAAQDQVEVFAANQSFLGVDDAGHLPFGVGRLVDPGEGSSNALEQFRRDVFADDQRGHRYLGRCGVSMSMSRPCFRTGRVIAAAESLRFRTRAGWVGGDRQLQALIEIRDSIPAGLAQRGSATPVFL
jgi:hypothetical protein